ncbi:SGNH/GDSL hydrolase family protein [Streptomyces sp. SCA3-4]|uniref:SGNH/GDSL hydrolase family protein n=1 Tax=Streptomyces sichuanensis TaxID=2871810 RepID=UPI001CE2827E|nr:SGNH/GDSL hydrolase family protein [Streptomyces sichuanensis]MCA6091583.1 SGNH/GDSL hydrolase family protein [Streptomyces sichuanensis]
MGTTRRPRHSIRLRAAAVALGTIVLATGCEGDAENKAAPAAPAPARPAWKTRPESLASLGDSITRGFDACSVLEDCPEVSWATGTEVDSLARRLLLSPQTSSWNYARTGARMADLPGQMRAAVAHRPQLVTVLLGANDACRADVAQMTPVDGFRADFETSLKTLRSSLPTSQVYVAGIPDLKRLWSEGRKSVLGKQIWKMASICPSMLRDADTVDEAAEERRAQVDKRVGEYNAVLKDVCSKDALCRYDHTVNGYNFTGQELSKWDWFHPSKKGQGELAGLAYRTITAEKPAA